jgi:putative ATPase
MDLFSAAGAKDLTPLAERMRPHSLEEFVGQEHLLGPGRILTRLGPSGRVPSLILWGPPGSGKTTLARLLAERSRSVFVAFSAVVTGVKEIRQVTEKAEYEKSYRGRGTILFVDEIHRFNKAQQDAFLPHVERGTITLIGATTENPSFEVIQPLLSRARVLVLEPLKPDEVHTLVERALHDAERGLGSMNLTLTAEAMEALIAHSRGDARVALNALEIAAEITSRGGQRSIDPTILQEALQHRGHRYDKKGEEHYNVISAFIKSLRGSDPDGAIYWLMRMIEAGEDPLFVARRMIIFAAEDVGNADPQALQVAVAAKDAFHFIGLPEGKIPLAQAATYLATAPKSNASFKAMLAAAKDVEEKGALPVPLHLRNAPTPLMKDLGYGKGYLYPHDFPEHVTDQGYLPEALQDKRYYDPSDSGYEKTIRERLETWERIRKKRAQESP